MIVLRCNPSPAYSVVLDRGRGQEKEVHFPALQRDWVCATCHGSLAVRVDPDGVTRAHCYGHADHPDDFIPASWADGEDAAQAEAIENLPDDLRRLVKGEGRKYAPNLTIFNPEKGEL